MGQALDLVDVVVGDQFAAAGRGEIGDHLDAAQLLGVQFAIDRLPGGVGGKSRMRLVANARANVNVVNTARDLGGRCVGRQLAALGVVVARHRYALTGRRNQRVRPLQVVVLQRRLVDLRSEGDFVLAVRLHRIEVFRTLGEGRIENIFAALGLRIGIVLLTAAGRQQEQQRQQRKQKKQRAKGKAKGGHGRQFTLKSAALAARRSIRHSPLANARHLTDCVLLPSE
jgi:hypothetical protein